MSISPASLRTQTSILEPPQLLSLVPQLEPTDGSSWTFPARKPTLPRRVVLLELVQIQDEECTAQDKLATSAQKVR